MSWFATVDSEVVYDGRVRVRIDVVEGAEGERFEREIVEALDSVAVVAVIDGDVVMIRQYRQASGRQLLELPAGLLDVDGEGAIETAARELAEETGLGGGELRVLGSFYASPGWTTERYTVVLATGVRPVGSPEGFEPTAEERHIEVVRLPFEEALAAVADGAVVDATAALGLLLAARARS